MDDTKYSTMNGAFFSMAMDQKFQNIYLQIWGFILDNFLLESINTEFSSASVLSTSYYEYIYFFFFLNCNWFQFPYNSKVSFTNTSLAAPGALAHRLQRRTACNAAPPATPHRPLNPTWLMECGNRLNLWLLDPPINFC